MWNFIHWLYCKNQWFKVQKLCLGEGESRSRHEKSVLKWRLKAAKMQIGSRRLDNGCPAWTTTHPPTYSSLSSSSSSSSSLHHHHHANWVARTDQQLSCLVHHPPTHHHPHSTEEPPRLISLCTSHLSQQDNLQQLLVEREILQHQKICPCHMMTWQSIWSKLASWAYSGITLVIKVFSLWRTS